MNDTSLPEGWLETTLGNICIINPKNKLDDDDTVGFLPMTAVPQTYGDKPDYQTRTWSDAKKGYTHFQENDVLFAKVTPCFENGKSMIAENCPAGVGSGSSELIVLRTDPSCVLPMLVLNLIRSYEFKQLGAQSMTGAVGLRRVPKSFVEQYPFPLPPIA
jgi:type I restriction enzyme S subunit